MQNHKQMMHMLCFGALLRGYTKVLQNLTGAGEMA
jgi:hypothetical protein